MSEAVPDQLTRVTQWPRFLLHRIDSPAGSDEARRWAEHGLTVRVVRGQKMRTDGALFDEVAAALQFPPYFGENWDALDECLGDLEWLSPGDGYVLYVLRAEEVLADEDKRSLGVLTKVLTNAVEEWAKEVATGEWWDHPATPFSVVLQVQPTSADSCGAHWAAAGATVEVLS